MGKVTWVQFKTGFNSRPGLYFGKYGNCVRTSVESRCMWQCGNSSSFKVNTLTPMLWWGHMTLRINGFLDLEDPSAKGLILITSSVEDNPHLTLSLH